VVIEEEQQQHVERDTTTTESQEGFHGWDESEVPRYVFDNFASVDLKTPFTVRGSHDMLFFSAGITGFFLF